MSVRRDRAMLACAIVVAIAVPSAILSRHWHRPGVVAVRVVTVRAARSPSPPDRALTRVLFSDAVRAGEAADALPPLVGIVGRLTSDGMAMVRDEGRTRSIRIGETAAGWRLIALSSEAATFERRGERRSVALPAGD